MGGGLEGVGLGGGRRCPPAAQSGGSAQVTARSQRCTKRGGDKSAQIFFFSEGHKRGFCASKTAPRRQAGKDGTERPGKGRSSYLFYRCCYDHLHFFLIFQGFFFFSLIPFIHFLLLLSFSSFFFSFSNLFLLSVFLIPFSDFYFLLFLSSPFSPFHPFPLFTLSCFHSFPFLILSSSHPSPFSFRFSHSFPFLASFHPFSFLHFFHFFLSFFSFFPFFFLFPFFILLNLFPFSPLFPLLIFHPFHFSLLFLLSFFLLF